MILLLTLMFIAVTSSADVDPKMLAKQMEMVRKYEEEVRQQNVDHPAEMRLIRGFHELMRKYECDRDDNDCKAWGATIVVDKLAVDEVNCDEDPDNEDCAEARELIGDEDKSKTDQQIMLGLLGMNMMDNKVLMKYINDIWRAIASYMCYKVPGYCKELRYSSLSCDILLSTIALLMFNHFRLRLQD